MFQFLKRNKEPSPASNSWVKFFAAIDKRKRVLADSLNRRTAYWPRRYLVVGLIVFCLLYGMLSVYFVFKGISGGNNRITVDAISVPALIPPQSVEGAGLSRAEYERMVFIRQYLDSLRTDPDGKTLHDHFMQQYPGMLDSINHVISIYEMNRKNEEHEKSK